MSFALYLLSSFFTREEIQLVSGVNCSIYTACKERVLHGAMSFVVGTLVFVLGC